MFCQKCGNQVDANSSFCMKCGNSLTSQPYINQSSPVQQRMNMRQSELTEIDRMIDYFSRKQNQYDEYDSVCERLNPNFLRKRPSLIIWGIVSAFFGLMFLLVSDYKFIGILLLLGAGGLFFAFIKNTQTRQKNYSEACRRYYELSEELYRHYMGYGPCLVSAGYSNPYNLLAIKQTIQSGRADTIADALNILLDDEHKAAMEAYSAQTAASAQEAARSAGIAANYSQASAVFSAANFFYNVHK